jgi:hypothetical protein
MKRGAVMADEKRVKSAREDDPERYSQRNLQAVKNQEKALAALEAAAKKAQAQSLTPKK